MTKSKSNCDWYGNPVKRGTGNYPYSYDPYVTYRKGEFVEAEHSSYSDRLLTQNWDKHDECCRQVFGDKGQYWHQREPEKIEAFLRLYFDKPELELVGILQGCNVSSGYPYWIFKFNCKF